MKEKTSSLQFIYLCHLYDYGSPIYQLSTAVVFDVRSQSSIGVWPQREHTAQL